MRYHKGQSKKRSGTLPHPKKSSRDAKGIVQIMGTVKRQPSTKMDDSSETEIKVYPQKFRLLDLPPEVFDMILCLCIRAGDLAIARVCHEIHARAKCLISLVGVYRIKAQEYFDEQSRSPKRSYWCTSEKISRKSMSTVRHIQITVVLGEPYPTVDVATERTTIPNTLGCINQLLTPKKNQIVRSCRIIFKHHGNEATKIVPFCMLKAFESFTYLESLAIEVEFGFWSRPITSDMPISHLTGALLRTENKPLFEQIQLRLEPTLGPAAWRYGHVQGGRYLELSPKMHLASIGDR